MKFVPWVKLGKSQERVTFLAYRVLADAGFEPEALIILQQYSDRQAKLIGSSKKNPQK